MRKQIPLAERLVVAADFKPEYAFFDMHTGLMKFCEKLKGTGVVIKLNSVLRAYGNRTISDIQWLGLKVFADLKLNDIPETLKIDGQYLQMFKPDLLTVMCSTGRKSLRVLKEELPETEILGVTVLTSMDEEECSNIYGCDINEVVEELARLAAEESVGGLICAPTDVPMLKAHFADAFTYNTPGIRPSWAIVAADDQNPDRVMTPYKAIRAGADRIVIGRPITQAKDPLDAVKRTLDEINQALA